MKKTRLKYKNILLLLLCIIIVIFIVGRFNKSDFDITFNSKHLEYGDKISKEMFDLKFKGEVVNDVKIDYAPINKLGEHKVTFTYERDNKDYRVTKKILIKDTTKPQIELIGNKESIVYLNNNYIELGVLANDNFDGNLSDKVKIEGKVDMTKVGNYKLTYKVIDSSKNESEIERIIKVTDESPISLNIKDFSLDGLFEGTILKETSDQGKEYIDKIIFIGDSIPLYYVMNKKISSKQLWQKNSITPETAQYTKININTMETDMTFAEAFAKYKPEITIITLGTNSISQMQVEYFIEEYIKFIKQIKEASPNTKVIVQSIPPISISYDQNNSRINNKKINTFNYYLAEMCHNLGIKFLNSAPSMKDVNGACKTGYCRTNSGENGIHPTVEGNQALIDYTRTHALIY